MHLARERFKYATFLVVTLLALMNPMPTQAQSPVSIDNLEQMFANIAAKTKWDMSKDMLWGYFFTNRARTPLEIAATDLSRKGYRLVDIYLSDKKKPTDPDLWWLHVERVETHSVTSLHLRNTELAMFAKLHGLDSYDGMDVGPVGGLKK